MGQGLHIPSGDSPWTHLNCASCSLFPCSPSSSLGLLKGRWARVVGGLFFLPRALEGHQTVRLVSFPRLSLPFAAPAFLLLSYQVSAHPTLFPPAPCPSSLPGDLFCFLLCFFFCFECLSLQVSVAGRSRSQRLQCKFPSPWGMHYFVLGSLGVFLFFRQRE